MDSINTFLKTHKWWVDVLGCVVCVLLVCVYWCGLARCFWLNTRLLGNSARSSPHVKTLVLWESIFWVQITVWKCITFPGWAPTLFNKTYTNKSPVVPLVFWIRIWQLVWGHYYNEQTLHKYNTQVSKHIYLLNLGLTLLNK